MTQPTHVCGCSADRAEAPAEPAEPGADLAVARAPLSRRAVLTGSAAVAAGLALAACSSPADTATTTPSSTPTPTTPTPTRSPTGSGSVGTTATAPDGEKLVGTSEVAVGGGVILAASVGNVVVTHPAGDEFKAFNARCPHQGCPVSSVADNTITCNCHGSTFDASTGDRTGGPAPTGLTPLDVTVEGDAVYLT